MPGSLGPRCLATLNRNLAVRSVYHAALNLAFSAFSRSARLTSDDGISCNVGDLAENLEDKGKNHIRGVPRYPHTQGKIER